MTDMRYRLLGNSGLRVSEYCLGTMTFGEDWGWGADEEGAREMLDRFADAGGNFIDTANNYTNGSSERMLGELLDGRREEFVLATKFTSATRPGDPNACGNGRKNMAQAVEASLDRLDTDYIDLLWVHAYDGMTPIEETMRGLDDLVSRGLVHHVGLSDYPAWAASRAVTLAEERGYVTPCALQIKYTLTERTPERELLPLARELGLGVTPWSPLDSGVLTGKYLDADADGRLSTTGREMTDEQERVARAVVEVADDAGCSPAQVVFAWLDAREAETGVRFTPIVGATTPEQLEDNLGALDVSLADEHVAQLNEASEVSMGFPGEFLNSEMIGDIIHNGMRDRIDR
ncbi:aldo/keto reductase [Haloglomus litoreum]|uniref:aldo/keto reductase n=1 Tax=Haloglomus litoreum TaxID=3034026 RepID=UPI0023E89BA5|nr:aldo/keto reductase [Haloglomus sp. DT116]